ncbi:hypothetical protein V6N12_031182 [Hibiscus sabdariffa]|uniref:Uncharacterized protein n=1 Tax=Hibiscus sabdariffa TaxID=183260 RepID=A0ABR2E879_9ROSI
MLNRALPPHRTPSTGTLHSSIRHHKEHQHLLPTFLKPQTPERERQTALPRLNRHQIWTSLQALTQMSWKSYLPPGPSLNDLPSGIE